MNEGDTMKRLTWECAKDVIPNGGAGPRPRVYPVTTLAVAGGPGTFRTLKFAPRALPRLVA